MAEAEESNDDVSVSLSANPFPSKWWVALVETLVSFLVVFFLLRYLSGAGRKYEPDWIAVAVLPVLFWLFYSGKLAGVKAFGVELKAALQRASIEPIVPDERIVFEAVYPEDKKDIEMIDSYISRKVPAISFELGRVGYYSGMAIKKYLEALLPHGFFRYVVFNDRDGRLDAIMPASKLYLAGSVSGNPLNGFNEIRKGIESARIRDLPGVVPARLALRSTDSKRMAIEKFARAEVEELPVVDGKGVLVGVVNRGKLQSELLASVFVAAGDKG
jgi:CBS domain-containing protein